jgi:hypothetical protein
MFFEHVAQSVEQRTFNAWVLGSIPSVLTTPQAANPYNTRKQDQETRKGQDCREQSLALYLLRNPRRERPARSPSFPTCPDAPKKILGNSIYGACASLPPIFCQSGVSPTLFLSILSLFHNLVQADFTDRADRIASFNCFK